jgi:hypothetical protein
MDNLNQVEKKYICKQCNKGYSSRQSLWNHHSIYHKGITPESTKPHKTNIEIHTSTPNSTKYMCNYCKKSFTRNSSLKRHYDRCEIKNQNEQKLKQENEELKKQISEQNKFFQQMIDNLKKELMEQINKNCKTHPKTLQKINNQLNNTVNNTINYNIVGLGHERLYDVLSKKEKINILNQRYMCLDHIIEYIHFNEKFPQFRNILITNTQNNIAYKFDKITNKFIAITKDDLLENIVAERMDDITEFYEQLIDDLDDKTKDIINSFITKMDNENYRSDKKKDIKLIVYNNRNKVSKEVIKDLEVII